MTVATFKVDTKLQNFSILDCPTWQRFLAALLAYVGAMLVLAYVGESWGLTDKTLTKILILAISPFLLVDYLIIRLRSVTSNFLGILADILAV